VSADLFTRGLELRSIEKSKRTVDFIASTDTIDSYDDVVEQDWVLDRYKANPIVLYGHNSRDILPIGKATRVEVVESNGRKQLECTIQIASKEANPIAEQVWNSLNEGTLRAVSVGFAPGDYRFEKRDGREVFVLSKNELHEISVVPIPANPDALAKMKAKAIAAAGNEPQPTAPTASTETNMLTEKEMNERIAKAEAEKSLADKQLADAQKDAASVKTELAATQGTVKALEIDRDAHKARADLAEASVIESEVGALVGVKILPAEKDTFVELRKSNPALFTKMVGQRPEMKLLTPVVPDEKGAPPTVVNGATGAGGDLANKIFGS
jgi:HK97 family phage prohead protease